MKVTAIIPSLNPDEKIVEVVEGLIKAGFLHIIIVNDGSDNENLHYFTELAKLPQCILLNHEVNKGKGAALKTAFKYYLDNINDSIGVVTVDGDNQHQPYDVINCCNEMINTSSLILGGRNFNGGNIPKRSRIGNKFTSGIFRFICGINISDTQTGLRVIPNKYIEKMLNINGERFEYETNMLLSLKKLSITYKEIPINTVYIEGNKTSHFRPVKDSFKIMGVLLKYIFGSFLSFVIDISIFTLCLYLFSSLDEEVRLLISTIIARIISSVFNFIVNKTAVFEHKGNTKNSILKYYTLLVCQLLCSYGLVLLFSKLFVTMSRPIIKALVDTVLFFISFQIQREWVFKHTKEEN